MPSDAVSSLAGSGVPVRVAVIDSGIHPDHPHVRSVQGGVGITPGGECADYLDRIGHGTAVAAAIREKAPQAHLLAVRVFDRKLAASVNSLVRAIDWAIDHDCHVINMSLGTSRIDHEARLGEAVSRAIDQGVIVVAAREVDGERLLPGSLPGVVGVAVDWECPRDLFRVEMSAEAGVIWCASGYPRSIPGVPPARNLMGISFAVANMTGFIARMLGTAGVPGLNPLQLLQRFPPGATAGFVDNPRGPA